MGRRHECSIKNRAEHAGGPEAARIGALAERYWLVGVAAAAPSWRGQRPQASGQARTRRINRSARLRTWSGDQTRPSAPGPAKRKRRGLQAGAGEDRRTNTKW